MEDDAGRLHALGRGLHRRGSCPIGDIGVSRRIDHDASQHRLAPGLRFREDTGKPVALQDRGDEEAVQHGVDVRFLHEAVGHAFEPFAVELVGEGLAFRHGRAHRLGALLEFPPYAAGLDRRLMAIPGEAFNADSGDVAAEEPEPLDQADLGSGPGGGQRRGKPARPGADHEDLGPVDDLDPPGGFGNEHPTLAHWMPLSAGAIGKGGNRSEQEGPTGTSLSNMG